jgi:hypothetical protein
MLYMNSRLCALIVGLVLIVSPGMRAQTPAASAPGTLRGDVDGDGRVTRADAEAVRAWLVRGTAPAGRSILPAGDANGDGRVTAADAALISRFAAGVDVSRFPVGRPVGEGGAGGGNGTGGRGYISTDYACFVDVVVGSTDCREVSSTAAGPDGPRLDVVAGTGPLTFSGSWVHSRGSTADEDTSTNTLSFTNSMGQPIGTVDGINAHPDGNRLFFVTVPYVYTVFSGTVAGASIALVTPDDTASFSNTEPAVTYSNKPYYQYNGIVAPGAASTSRQIRFIYSANVKVFGYTYRVWTPVQFESGRIIITPDTVPVLAPAETASLTGTVYDAWGQVLSETITWSSSNTAVATVNASTGEVTAVGQGTATITALSTVNAQRTGTHTIAVDEAPEVTSTTPANDATAFPVTDNIVINFSEPVSVSANSFLLECPVSYDEPRTFVVSGSGTSTITIDPDEDLPAGTVCTVTVQASVVSDEDAIDGPDVMELDYVFSFETAIQAIDDVLADITTGNVRINTASTSPVFSVTENDKITGSTTITFAGWSAVAGKTMAGGDVVMVTEGAGMGTFTYNPPAGFEGTDSLEYTITNDFASSSAKVALPVSGMIWFIDNAGAACTTSASGCGRLTNPYSSLAAFNAENNGTGSNPAAGEGVFLYESATPYTGPVTLLPNQNLIGQDAGASLSTLSGITPVMGSDALPEMNAGGDPVTITGTSGGVVLAVDNLLRGFSIATTGGTALSGTGFGTLTISEVPVSATGGAALSLENGTLNSTFPSVSSTNSTGRGISLTNVSGSPTFSAGSISGAAQAAFLVSGGSVGFTWPGNITQTSAAPLLSVAGGHSGTLAFSAALTATNGPGMQFNDADGAYNFTGSASLSGDNAAVDITNGSAGTFSFNNGTQITNSAGAANSAFYVYGSTAAVTYSGNITKSSLGNAVEIGEHSGGTVTFQTGTISITAGSGIQFSNADATYNFNGTTTLNGGDAGIDIISGSNGTFAFSAGTSVGGTTSPTGTAFTVNGSTPNVTFNGNLTKSGTSTGLLVDITNQASGTITFQTGTLSSTSSNGTGIQLSNADGTVNFNGTNTLSGGNNGVDVIGGATGSIAFSATTSITNPSGTAFLVSNSSPSLTYAGTITANSSRAVAVSNTSAAACGTATFSGNLAGSGAAASGILVDRCNAGTLTFSGASKSFSTQGNGAVTITNNGATVNFTNGGLAINTTSGAGFSASGGGTVNVEGTTNTVTSTTGTAVSISNTTIGANGVRFRSVSASGAANGIFLNNTGTSGGQFQVTGDGSTPASGGTITNTTGGDGATGGNGIYLNAVRNVSLNWMALSGHANNGLYGAGVRGLTVNKVRITGNNGTSNSGTFNESAVHLVNVGGPVKLTNSIFNGGAMNGLRVDNSLGTAPALDSLVMENDTVSHIQGSTVDQRGTAMLVTLMDGTADTRIRNNRITYWWANAIHVLVQGTASGTARITGNFADNTNGALGGAGGIWIAGCNLQFNLSTNTVRHTNGTAIAADKANCAGTTFQGTIDGNTIGVAGDANSGSFTGIGIFVAGRNGTTTVKVSNNILRQINGSASGAITLMAGDNVLFPPSGTLNATVSGNNIQESGTTVNSAQHGILVTHGTTSSGAGDSHQGCYDVLNNTITNFVNGTANNRIRVNQRFSTTSRWPGYTGGSASTTDLGTYLLARNTASTSQNANTSTGGFLNTAPAGSACPQPSM